MEAELKSVVRRYAVFLVLFSVAVFLLWAYGAEIFALLLQKSPAYTPPTWPDAVSSAQMHLDFDVDNLDATEARALAAGATKYDFQPNDHCRVFADPAGHPFCLSTFQALQEQA